MYLSVFGLIGGMCLPMQTSVNTQLGKRVGSPITATMINFSVGLGALIITALIWERSLRIPFDAIASAPPWILLGGVFAVVFVTGNVFLMPRLGGVQTVIFPALGQIIMGTLIDTFGWFDSAQRAMTPLRVLGVALVFFGVFTAIIFKSGGFRQFSKSAGTQVKNIWLWRLFAVVAGMFMASQTAVNSHLGIVVDSRIYAAVINFSIGLALLIILHFVLLKTKKPGVKEGRMPAWFLLGGLFADMFVVGNIITAQTVGTGMAVVIQLTGFIIGGLLVDQFGLFRSMRRPIGWQEIGGVLLMVIGAMLFHLT